MSCRRFAWSSTLRRSTRRIWISTRIRWPPRHRAGKRGSVPRVSHGAWRATFVALAFAVGLPCCAAALDLTPPETLVDFTRESLFGRTLDDPYRWLENTETPEVIAWFHAQNEYTRSVLDALPGRAALHRRLVELNGADTHIRDVQLAGDALAYMKRAPDDTTFKLYGRDTVNGPERLLLDPARYNQDGQAAAIEYFSLSPDGKRLAVGVALGGTEDATLHVIDVAMLQEIGAPIPRTRGANPSWRYDSEILFYTQQRERTEGEPVANQLRGSRAYMRTYAPSGTISDVAIFGNRPQSRRRYRRRRHADGPAYRRYRRSPSASSAAACRTNFHSTSCH